MQAQIMQMQAANQQMQTPATKHVVPPSKGAAVQQRQVNNPEDRQPAVPDGPFSQVKRPKGSYFMFHHEQSTILRNQNPNSTTVEIAKLTGERWHALTETEKKKYQDMALVDKQRYEREIREEAAANGGKVLPVRGQSQKAAERAAKARGLGTAKKQPEKPKQALTPFFVFMKKRRAELKNSDLCKTVTAFTKQIAEEWNAMSVEEKLKYKHDGEYGLKILADSEGAAKPTPVQQKPAIQAPPQMQQVMHQQPPPAFVPMANQQQFGQQQPIQ